MPLCVDAPFEVSSPCVRLAWTTFVPTCFVVSIVVVYLLSSIRICSRAFSFIAKPFRNFLTLQDVLGYPAKSGPTWSAIAIATVALAQVIVRLVFAAYAVASHPHVVPWRAVLPFIAIIPWIYASVVPLLRPSPTVPYSIFTLTLLELFASFFDIGAFVYDRYVLALPPPSAMAIAGATLNLLSILIILSLILNMPMNVPVESVDKEKIGYQITPEDYSKLGRWITFSWVYPLIKRGTNTTLNEPDVWALSPTMEARPIFQRFSAIVASTLLGRLWLAGSLDIILDFVLTLVSVTLSYASPFFLKRILDSLDADVVTPSYLFNGYIFALLAFAANVLKAQVDLAHLWYGRRVSTRLRTGAMAAIYDKALKRKDFSGLVEKKADVKDPKGGKDKPAVNSSGADVAKIVQLMSSDANAISLSAAAMHMLYSAPFEIIIAMSFLYQLLGVSAFTGLLLLLLSSPLNTALASRSVKINKGLLGARDQRMSVVNEIINCAKLIKFFAWEDKWIDRALEKRKVELRWMVKARLNSIVFYLVWTLVPVTVSVSSFLVYVLLGNQLTIAKAFTSIALFGMLRNPLTVIPAYCMAMLQSYVSIKRIDTFLNEPEVDEQVSSLKKDALSPPDNANGSGSDHDASPLGIQNGTFRWNSVEDKKKESPKDDGKKKASNGSNGTEPEPVPSAAVEENNGTTEDHQFELRDINVIFPDGQLTVVTGPTASGKTALLMALLGEMTLQPSPPGVESKILLDKNPHKIVGDGLTQTIAFAAQTSWLQHQSIRDNIIFGSPFDQERYDQVVEACALRPDFDILEDGDLTEIGAKYVFLEILVFFIVGSRIHRVALARAVYSRTKYVLLDDPLSAVDSHTARILYDKVFRGPLLKNRTVVLVTHHVELVLPGTYYLVRMLDGRIDLQGKVEDLRKSGILEFIEQEAHQEVAEEKSEEKPAEVSADRIAGEVTAPAGEGNGKPAADKKPRKLVEEEVRAKGSVKWSVYNTYLKASAYWVWCILFLFIAATQLLGVGEKLWISVWGDAYKDNSTSPVLYMHSASAVDMEGLAQHPMTNFHIVKNSDYYSSPVNTWTKLPSALEHPLFYVGIYAAIGFGGALFNVASNAVQYTGALRASRILFRQLLSSVVFATVRFHDTTPAGRILNRFSKDIETIDSSLASSLQNVNTSVATFVAALITVSAIFPIFLIPAFFLGYFYVKLAIGYLNTGRDLRRMESTNRSPIFSGFSELLDGIVTVRAFSAERRFLEGLFAKIDVFTNMGYTYWMTNRWLLLYYDFFGALAILVTTLLALAGRVPAGFAGLTITSAMAFTNSIYWTCRHWTTLETDLNSVERIVEYLDLPQQPPRVIESNRPPAYWPSNSGADDMIVVKNLEVKYAPQLPSVIHGISFTLKPRERIGLLGRTGSGKSTLAMSILRFVDPHQGSITIDGIDITSIGLHDLRSRLVSEYTDAECIDALQRVHMITPTPPSSKKASRAPSIVDQAAEAHPETGENVNASASSETAAAVTAAESTTTTVIAAEPGKERTAVSLETKVSAGGVNFSQGQRQLIAMARALLRQSSIVILDEATSSIDFETDAKIQATIREEFKDSLLLTVAHRLRTVIDYDRLLVLDQGNLVEFDTPFNLIQKENGIFRNMCLKSGTYQELEDAARAQAFSPKNV
ncbi:hypothetical protein SISNIDRAFT_454002 [Sistotremastrum niveocremeum HHB9708]|uniref:P-loop containing nucleoside triphosphate hydrolase protein n=1 Tax=Sistotremastrum niveocremeum HHB9708 TaxID=1314777 RepID=A0A164VLM8_9AGAM|nr:hypothetical protein SISNIDRAFT_454002 [Sistotremastrum niveocremeum HHB9708]